MHITPGIIAIVVVVFLIICAIWFILIESATKSKSRMKLEQTRTRLLIEIAKKLGVDEYTVNNIVDEHNN